MDKVAIVESLETEVGKLLVSFRFESLTQHATRVLRLDSGRLQSDERGAAGTIVGKGKAAVKDALDTAEEVVDTVRRPVEAAIHGGLATAKALTGVAKDIAEAARPKRKE